DKWGGLHWYTPHYDHHFGPLREAPVRLLEIGIGGYDVPEAGGGSLRMWQRYFRRGLIHGLDIFEKRLNEPRIRTVRGDQNDPAPDHTPSYTDAHVTAVHLYHNIAFIAKGYNDECGPARKPA